MFELRPYRRHSNEISYNPFREMEEFEKKFFDEPFSPFFQSRDIAEFKTDITDEGDHYVLETDLPGFEKKDIHLDLSDNMLTINAERHSDHEEKDKKQKYIRVERSYGKYSRQFDVSSVDTENIKAEYKNGVLRLTLPKKQEDFPETRHLEIE